MKLAVSLFCAFALPFATVANAQTATTVEQNVVYGMYSGLALLMDVHRPPTDSSNGYGVIFIQGCGWHQSQEANADQLKEGKLDVIAAKYAERATDEGTDGYNSRDIKAIRPT